MIEEKQLLLQSLKRKGFSKEILKAFEKVKRENFVPENLKDRTYEDTALPIGKGQTISQPYTIATMFFMLNLRKGQKVLEIGSGCGYVLALISRIVGKKGKVFGIEIIPELTEKSKKNLKEYRNVKIYIGNGKLGLPKEKPFDRIIISAGYNEIPKPLVEQLKEKGIIVAPIGNIHGQSLVAFEKINGKLKLKKEIQGFIFVPLVEQIYPSRI
ncbi:MAG: protein-L-isoaspartate O-methyltransferase [Nanoarchaeota archaeon]